MQNFQVELRKTWLFHMAGTPSSCGLPWRKNPEVCPSQKAFWLINSQLTVSLILWVCWEGGRAWTIDWWQVLISLSRLSHFTLTSCYKLPSLPLIIMGLDHFQISRAGFQRGLHGNENHSSSRAKFATNPLPSQWVTQDLPMGPPPEWSLIPALRQWPITSQ